MDFIQDGPLAETGKQPPRIRLCEFLLIGHFQIDIVEMLEGRTAERGIPGLSRTGHSDDWVLFEQAYEAGSHLALDHSANWLAVCEIALSTFKLSSRCDPFRQAGHPAWLGHDQCNIIQIGSASDRLISTPRQNLRLQPSWHGRGPTRSIRVSSSSVPTDMSFTQSGRQRLSVRMSAEGLHKSLQIMNSS